MRDVIGVVHGRFQLLHNEHMKYILAGKRRCEHLIIGICNPDITYTKYTDIDPHRSKHTSNPFTFYERFEMIKVALLESGISLLEFDIVPFPINYPELIFNYVPYSAKHYITIYDNWGLKKKDILEKLGFSVEVMWQKDLSQKIICATDIRNYIKEDKPWNQFVPPSVYKYILKHNLDQKIKTNC